MPVNSSNPVKTLVAISRASGLRPAVVLGSSVNGLSYLRSFHRHGIPVLCADAIRGTASWSRCAPFVQLIEPRSQSKSAEDCADNLLAFFSDSGVKPYVFGTSDSWQIYVSDRLEARDCPFDAIAPCAATMARIIDKQAQYEAADGLGIPVPRFANARSVHEGSADWSHFPAIIKPRWAHSGRDQIGGKAIRTDHAIALKSWLQVLADLGCAEAYLVQELISGGDRQLFAYLGCYDFEGREFSYVLKNKLRQHPPQLGDGSYEVTVEEPALAELARRLLSGLNYRGLVGVEFKRSAIGYMLIEINPRTVSTNQLAIVAGVDFPWHAYQILTHRSNPERLNDAVAPTARAGRAGVFHMHEERDLQSLPARRRTGELTVLEWLKCALRTKSFAIWSIRDPWPGLCTFAGLLARSLRRCSPRKPSSTSSATSSVAAAPAAGGGARVISKRGA